MCQMRHKVERFNIYSALDDDDDDAILLVALGGPWLWKLLALQWGINCWKLSKQWLGFSSKRELWSSEAHLEQRGERCRTS